MLAAALAFVAGAAIAQQERQPGFDHYGYAYDDDAGNGYGYGYDEPRGVAQGTSVGDVRLVGNSGSNLRGRLEVAVVNDGDESAGAGSLMWATVCSTGYNQTRANETCATIEDGSTLVKTYTATQGENRIRKTIDGESCRLDWSHLVAILCAPAVPAKTCRGSNVCSNTAQTNALQYENSGFRCEGATCTVEECCTDALNASFAVAFHARVHTAQNSDVNTTKIALEVPAALKAVFEGVFDNGPFRDGTEPTIQYFPADTKTFAPHNAEDNVRTLYVTSATRRADAGNCTNDKRCGYHEIVRTIHGQKANDNYDNDIFRCKAFNAIGNDTKISTEIESFDLFGSKGGAGLFYSCEFEKPQAVESLDVSNVENFINMFNHAPNFNGSLESWNVGSATKMNGMFDHAKAFDGIVGGWDVRNVAQFTAMFHSACAFTGRESSGGKTIQDWNVSSGVSFYGMFDRSECANAAAEEGISYNLSSWHTSLSPTANINYIFRGYANTSTLKSDTCWYPGDGECEYQVGYGCAPNLTKCDGYQPPPGGDAVVADEDARRRERRGDDPDAVVLFDIVVKPPGVGNAPIMIPGTMAQFNRNDHCSRHARLEDAGLRSPRSLSDAQEQERFCSAANASFYFDAVESPCKGETCDAADCCKGGTESSIIATITERVNTTATAEADVDVVVEIGNAPADFDVVAALAGHAITLHDVETANTAAGTIKSVDISIDKSARRNRRQADNTAFIATATVAFTAKIETPFKPGSTLVMVGPKQEPKPQKKSSPKLKLKLKKSTTSGTPVATAVVAVAAIVVVVVVVGAMSLKSERTRKGNSGDYAAVYTRNPAYNLDNTF